MVVYFDPPNWLVFIMRLETSGTGNYCTNLMCEQQSEIATWNGTYGACGAAMYGSSGIELFFLILRY